MNVHVYTTTRNEGYLMPYFLRHYETFADLIFVLDDDSTDGTRPMVERHSRGVLLDYPGKKGLDEVEIAEAYRSAVEVLSPNADWVMFPDVDEIVYHPYMLTRLRQMQNWGVRAIKSVGYAMVSDRLPQGQGQIYEEVKTGMRERRYDKTIVFNPKIDATFGNGRHSITTPRPEKLNRCGIKLLHYCYLGWPYIEARIKRNFARIPGATPEALDYRLRRAKWGFRHRSKKDLQEVI